MRAEFWSENLQESGRLVDVGAEGKTRQQIHPKRPHSSIRSQGVTSQQNEVFTVTATRTLRLTRQNISFNSHKMRSFFQEQVPLSIVSEHQGQRGAQNLKQRISKL